LGKRGKQDTHIVVVYAEDLTLHHLPIILLRIVVVVGLDVRLDLRFALGHRGWQGEGPVPGVLCVPKMTLLPAATNCKDFQSETLSFAALRRATRYDHERCTFIRLPTLSANKKPDSTHASAGIVT
jgi:hypothetical protein